MIVADAVAHRLYQCSVDCCDDSWGEATVHVHQRKCSNDRGLSEGALSARERRQSSSPRVKSAGAADVDKSNKMQRAS